MKKATKIRLVTIIVLVTMTLSVLSYPFLSVFAPQAQINELTTYVITGQLDEATKQFYVQRGLTFMEVHFNDLTRYNLASLEGLPKQFTTPYGEIQLIVIEVRDDERSFIKFESMTGTRETESFDLNEIGTILCDTLFYSPLECISNRINSTPQNLTSQAVLTGQENETSATQTTISGQAEESNLTNQTANSTA